MISCDLAFKTNKQILMFCLMLSLLIFSSFSPSFQELLVAAHFQQIIPLENICIDSLAKNITISKAMRILHLAEQQGYQNLASFVFYYIAKNFHEFTLMEDWMILLNHKHLRKVIMTGDVCIIKAGVLLTPQRAADYISYKYLEWMYKQCNTENMLDLNDLGLNLENQLAEQNLYCRTASITTAKHPCMMSLFTICCKVVEDCCVTCTCNCDHYTKQLNIGHTILKICKASQENFKGKFLPLVN